MTLKPSDWIALTSAAFALVALVVSIYATHNPQRIATSGFQSAQRLKSDTAGFLSSLRGIMIKSAAYTQQDRGIRDYRKGPEYIDIGPEKLAIQAFLNSPTAVAYYAFVIRKSEQAQRAGVKGEEWRLFFLLLVELLYTDNTYQAGKLAARIEKMFDGVSDQDIEEMSSQLEDLPGTIRKIVQGRQYDPLIHVLVDEPGKREEPSFEDFVASLRGQGIEDPDVDLFWSAMSGDLALAEDALKRGAKPNVREGEIRSRYKELWEKFRSEGKKQE